MDNIKLAPGLTWIHDGVECVLVKHLVNAIPPGAIIKRDGEYEEISLHDVARQVIAAAWLLRPELQEQADDDWRIAVLPDDAKEHLLLRLRAVNEVNTGSPTGHLTPDMSPRPDFDPRHTTVTDRARAMASELGVDLRTVQSWRAKVKESGPIGLMHGNRRPVQDPLSSFDEEEIAIAADLVAVEIERSTKTQNTLGAMLRSRFRAAGLEPLSASRADILLKECARGQSLYGTATTRKSKRGRPKGGRGWDRLSAVNQEWEIDSIRADVMAFSPFDPNGVRVWGIAITDAFSRGQSLHLTTLPPSATSAAIGLFKRINPLFLEDDRFPPELLFGIPDRISIDRQFLVHPGGPPGRVTMDLGREFENQMVTSLLDRIGSDVSFAQPRRGAHKPKVESANSKCTALFQLFPGYKGNSVANRGSDLTSEKLLTLEQMQGYANGWCAQHNTQPHTGLRHPGDPSALLTPAQMQAASIIAGAYPSIQPQTNLIFQFLPVAMAAVTGTGPSINNITYTMRGIEKLRNISAGDERTEPRQLPFRYDPNDKFRVYWHEPGTPFWHTLYAFGDDRRAVAPFMDILNDRLMNQPGQRRATKTTKQQRASLLLDYINEHRRNPAVKKAFSDEWLAFSNMLFEPGRNQLRDPSLGEITIEEVIGQGSGLYGSLDEPGSDPAFEFDFDAYFEAVPEPGSD